MHVVKTKGIGLKTTDGSRLVSVTVVAVLIPQTKTCALIRPIAMAAKITFRVSKAVFRARPGSGRVFPFGLTQQTLVLARLRA
jgi:hypothetical protein